jgi:L-iditol 2-dehydrogenase
MAGGCGLPTALHAVERADVELGDTVLVLGTGPVGLSAIALSRLRGATRVLAIGAPETRLDAAGTAGAEAVLDFRGRDEAECVQWVRDHNDGRGADITIEATGVPEAAVQAMRFTRDAGTVVIVGQYTDRGDATFNPHLDLNQKHLDVRGCWGSEFRHFYRALQVLGDTGRARPWSALPTSVYALDRAAEALADVEAGSVVKALLKP